MAVENSFLELYDDLFYSDSLNYFNPMYEELEVFFVNQNKS